MSKKNIVIFSTIVIIVMAVTIVVLLLPIDTRRRTDDAEATEQLVVTATESSQETDRPASVIDESSAEFKKLYAKKSPVFDYSDFTSTGSKAKVIEPFKTSDASDVYAQIKDDYMFHKLDAYFIMTSMDAENAAHIYYLIGDDELVFMLQEQDGMACADELPMSVDEAKQQIPKS